MPVEFERCVPGGSILVHIQAFEVVNLGSRVGPRDRELDRHVNVFWGLNGSGKTTLLKILHSALDNGSTELGELPFEAASVILRDDASKNVLRRAYRQRRSSDGRVLKEHRLIREDDDGWILDETETSDWDSHLISAPRNAKRTVPVNASFTHSYLPISRVTEFRPRYWQGASYRTASDTRPVGPEERFVEQVRRRWQAYRSESLSRVRDIQQVGLAQILAILFGSAIPIFSRPVGVGAEDAYRLVQNFLREQRISFPVRREDFVSRYEESVEHQQVVAKIVEVQKQADEVLRPQREFQAVIDEFYSGDKHLILNRTPSPRDALSIEIGDRAIPLKALSSGEKQLLQLLLEVLAAEDTTVMIDEPELSMHVDWQQRLVQSMRRINPNCQLILATHSPEVMVDVDDAVIFEL